jgi:hypothetical protein
MCCEIYFQGTRVQAQVFHSKQIMRVEGMMGMPIQQWRTMKNNGFMTRNGEGCQNNSKASRCEGIFLAGSGWVVDVKRGWWMPKKGAKGFGRNNHIVKVKWKEKVYLGQWMNNWNKGRAMGVSRVRARVPKCKQKQIFVRWWMNDQRWHGWLGVLIAMVGLPSDVKKDGGNLYRMMVNVKKTMGNTRKDNGVFENDISMSWKSSWDIMGVQDVLHGNLKHDMLLVKLLLSSLLEVLCHHCHHLPPSSYFYVLHFHCKFTSSIVFHLSFNTLVFFYLFQCFHVLQFYCKFSSSIVLLLWFSLLWFHLQQLCLLPRIIPSPTSATPSCIINIAILFLSLLFFFAFFWFCSLIAIFFYLFSFFFPLPFFWFCSLIFLPSNLVLLFSIFVTALQAPSYIVFLSTYSCVQMHQQCVKWVVKTKGFMWINQDLFIISKSMFATHFCKFTCGFTILKLCNDLLKKSCSFGLYIWYIHIYFVPIYIQL